VDYYFKLAAKAIPLQKRSPSAKALFVVVADASEISGLPRDTLEVSGLSRRLSVNIARIREHLAKIAEETLKDFQELLGTMKKHRNLVRGELKKSSKKVKLTR
jgi:hypothetical protein